MQSQQTTVQDRTRDRGRGLPETRPDFPLEGTEASGEPAKAGMVCTECMAQWQETHGAQRGGPGVA